MSDKDREAFEAWYVLRCKAKSLPPRHGDNYIHADPTLTWHGWQAAKAHYAPKLTFMDAVKSAAKGIGVGGATGYAVKAITALRAAGVRFAEEA